MFKDSLLKLRIKNQDYISIPDSSLKVQHKIYFYNQVEEFQRIPYIFNSQKNTLKNSDYHVDSIIKNLWFSQGGAGEVDLSSSSSQNQTGNETKLGNIIPELAN